jgi:3-phytase
LEDDGSGKIGFTKVREFGKFSGLNEHGDGEIEAVAVDDELGYVYYSDELFGVRKYHADPDMVGADIELGVFGTEGFKEDREGISIYKKSHKTGYIIVSDQGANQFHIFSRQAEENDPHKHKLLKIINTSTIESDGSEVCSKSLGSDYPNGIFIAMSDEKTFHYYSWRDFAVEDF